MTAATDTPTARDILTRAARHFRPDRVGDLLDAKSHASLITLYTMRLAGIPDGEIAALFRLPETAIVELDLRFRATRYANDWTQIGKDAAILMHGPAAHATVKAAGEQATPNPSFESAAERRQQALEHARRDPFHGPLRIRLIELAIAKGGFKTLARGTPGLAHSPLAKFAHGEMMPRPETVARIKQLCGMADEPADRQEVTA
jgi:hypothetical protein